MKRSILAAMLLATTAGGAAMWQAPAIAQAVMGTKSGVDQSLIDHSVKPGDDFNAYANGVWLKTAEIPADRSSIGVGLDVFKVAEARNADIIKGAAASKAKWAAAVFSWAASAGWTSWASLGRMSAGRDRPATPA